MTNIMFSFCPIGTDFDIAASSIMTVTLQQADQMVPVPFDVLDDNLFEGAENIILALSIPTNSRTMLGTNQTATISIADNEGIIEC